MTLSEGLKKTRRKKKKMQKTEQRKIWQKICRRRLRGRAVRGVFLVNSHLVASLAPRCTLPLPCPAEVKDNLSYFGSSHRRPSGNLQAMRLGWKVLRVWVWVGVAQAAPGPLGAAGWASLRCQRRGWRAAAHFKPHGGAGGSAHGAAAHDGDDLCIAVHDSA